MDEGQTERLRGTHLQSGLCQSSQPLLTAGVVSSLKHEGYLQGTCTEQSHHRLCWYV